MPVHRMSDSVTLEIAERYGVSVKFVAEYKVPKRYRGPEGQGCNPAKRLLYVEETDWASIEHAFHELVHIIVQPPWWSIMKMPEEVILFQFERALADTTLEDWAYEQVVGWQCQTGITIAGRFPGDLCLGDLPDYKEQPFWQYGYGLCQRLGLLDAKNRPTYRWPDWSRIETHKDAIWRYFQTRAQTPLPQFEEGCRDTRSGGIPWKPKSSARRRISERTGSRRGRGPRSSGASARVSA